MHVRSKIKKIDRDVLGKNHDRDIEVINTICALFQRYQVFTLKDLAYMSGKFSKKDDPNSQFFARSVARLVDSKFLSKENVLSERGAILDTVYRLVGDPELYKNERFAIKEDYDKEAKARRERYIEKMKHTAMVILGPEDEYDESE